MIRVSIIMVVRILMVLMVIVIVIRIKPPQSTNVFIVLWWRAP